MKKARFLMLIIICGMALLGGSYAVWSDHLAANDVVKTGVFNIQWADGTTGSAARTTSTDSQSPGTTDPNYPDDAKDVGYLNVSVDSDNETAGTTLGAIEGYSSDPRVQGDKMTINLGKAYPGYSAKIYSKIINTGTVSAKFSVSASCSLGNNKFPQWLHVQIKKDDGSTIGGTVLSDSDNWFNGNVDTLQGTVIDPKDELPVVIVEEIRASSAYTVPYYNSNQEDRDFTYTLQLIGEQWNGDSADGSFKLPSWSSPLGRK